MDNVKVAKELIRMAKGLADEEKVKTAALTKKYFIEIGKILKEHGKGNKELIDAFADFFASDNPNFDRNRFINFVK